MSPHASKIRCSRGATMVEVIVAVTLLSAGLALTCEVLYRAALLRRENERRQCALLEAANAMERAGGWSWQELTAEPPPQIVLSESARRQLPQGELELRIAEDADDPSARRVIVKVSWLMRSGQPAAPVQLIAWRWNVAEDSP